MVIIVLTYVVILCVSLNKIMIFSDWYMIYKPLYFTNSKVSLWLQNGYGLIF